MGVCFASASVCFDWVIASVIGLVSAATRAHERLVRDSDSATAARLDCPCTLRAVELVLFALCSVVCGYRFAARHLPHLLLSTDAPARATLSNNSLRPVALADLVGNAESAASSKVGYESTHDFAFGAGNTSIPSAASDLETVVHECLLVAEELAMIVRECERGVDGTPDSKQATPSSKLETAFSDSSSSLSQSVPDSSAANDLASRRNSQHHRRGSSGPFWKFMPLSHKQALYRRLKKVLRRGSMLGRGLPDGKVLLARAAIVL